MSEKTTRLFRRFLPDFAVDSRERQIRQAVRELRRYTDRELSDVGIPRGKIEHCVRHGRPTH